MLAAPEAQRSGEALGQVGPSACFRNSRGGELELLGPDPKKLAIKLEHEWQTHRSPWQPQRSSGQIQSHSCLPRILCYDFDPPQGRSEAQPLICLATCLPQSKQTSCALQSHATL